MVQEEASLWRKASKPRSTAMLHHPVTGASRGEVLVGASLGMEGRQQIFQLRALPLITREERFTGCTTGRSWGLACWLSSHAPPTCAASSMSAKSFRTHSSSPDVLPNNIPSKPCSLQNQILEVCLRLSPPCPFNIHSSFYLEDPSCPLCGNHAQTQIPPLFLSFFPQTFHTQWLKYWLLAERYLTPPTILLTPSFVTFEKAIIFYLIYVYIWMHFMVSVWSQRTIWGDKFPLGKWVLGTELKWSGLEPCPFMHTVISVTFHSTLHAEVSGNALSTSNVLKGKAIPFRYFLLPSFLICFSQGVLNIYCMVLGS